MLTATPPIRLLLDRILVRPDTAPVRVGLIHLPDEAVDGLKVRTRTGTVVAVGPGRRDKKGNLRPCDVKPGDTVEIAGYCDGDLGPEGRSAMPVTIDGEEFLIMNEADIAGRYVEAES